MGLALSFFVIIITSTICWLLCTIYIQLLSANFSKKIRKSNSALESCQYRRRYRKLLFIEKIVFIILALIGTFSIFVLVYEMLLNLGYPPNNPIEWFRMPHFWIIYFLIGFYYIVLMLTNSSYSPYEVVTSMTHKDVKNDYVLFLRGFGNDNYLSVPYQEKNKRKDYFSEHHFMRRLLFIQNAYAVGRPEELKNPSGATRVYLDNESWQSDVRELMYKANCVIILLNDKPNCVWEIAQTEKIKSKVIYIVNNKNKYVEVCKKLPQFKVLENIPSEDHFFIYYDKNGTVKCRQYKNTGSSYWGIINIVRKICR